MADNISVKDATGATVVLRSTDLGTSQVPHHYIDAQPQTVTNVSGTVGTSAVSVIAASSTRLGWLLQNQHASLPLYYNILGVTAVAGQPSLVLAAGATVRCPQDVPLTLSAISVLGSTSSQPFAALSW